MWKFLFCIVILENLYFTLSRRAEEFSFSSSLVPLYMQNQIFNPLSSISLSKQRLLQSIPGDPYIILITSSFPSAQCEIGNDTQSAFQGIHIDIFK